MNNQSQQPLTPNNKHLLSAVTVVAAALGINLVIGVLYAWSIFKESIVESIHHKSGFTWSLDAVNDPYALCCLVFALTMIPAGRFQDHFGPSKSSLVGALLGGSGFLLIANSHAYWAWMIGFGGLIGAGIGFAYASTTPAALKWFAHTRSGLVTGIVVSGFALASTYIAPLATYMVKHHGLHNTMLFFSLQFFGLISLFAFFLKRPPIDHQPIGFVERRKFRDLSKQKAFAHHQYEVENPMDVLKQAQFRYLWILLFLGAGAGLMVIANIKPIAKASMGELAFYAIVILAVGDAIGRILAGTLSSRFGRRKVLSVTFFVQMILMFVTHTASTSGQAIYIMIVATLVGINYGVNLVVFPNYVKDFWGMRNFGLIYGLLFTAWGVGGLILVKVSETLVHATHDTAASFNLAGVLILIGFLFTFKIDNRKDLERLALRKQNKH